MRIDELEQVIVAAQDDDVEALFNRFDGQGADDVVRLVPVDFEQRHLHRFEHVAAPGDLLTQPGRRGFARALVRRELGQAKARAAHVKRGRGVLWVQILEGLQQHAGEGVDTCRQLTPGVGERTRFLQRVKPSKDERVAVNQHQQPLSHLTGSRRGHPASLRPTRAARRACARDAP